MATVVFERKRILAPPKVIIIQVARSGDACVQIGDRKPWVVERRYAEEMIKDVVRACEGRLRSGEQRKLTGEFAEEDADPTDQGSFFT
jgi:hypothetical protein